MTWQTPDGDRILVQEEAALVREGVALIVDQIHDNIRFGEHERLWDFDVRLFDELDASQQLETINQVSHHLLSETAKVAELSAINEAAVQAIYQAITTEVEIEIDTQHEGAAVGSAFVFFWRKRVAHACLDCFSDSIADGPDDSSARNSRRLSGALKNSSPNVRCRDVSRWREAIQALGNRVLWEREVEVVDPFAEIEPEGSSMEVMMNETSGVQYRGDDGVWANPRADESGSDDDAIRALTRQKPR